MNLKRPVAILALLSALAYAAFAQSSSGNGSSGSQSSQSGSTQAGSSEQGGATGSAADTTAKSSAVQPAATNTVAISEALQSSLYAVGSIGSSNLYFLYVALGMLGDGYAKSTYDAKTTTALLSNLSDLA